MHPFLLLLELLLIQLASATVLRGYNSVHPPHLYCYAGSLGVVVEDNNRRALVSHDSGAAHSSVQCLGPVHTSCGDLHSPLAKCNSKHCSCSLDADKLLWPYQRALAAQVLQRCSLNSTNSEKPKLRVLNVGLGAGALAMHVAHHCPTAQLETIEVDPTMIDLARNFFGFDGHVELADALTAVRRRAAEGDGYDVVMVDCFDNKSVAPSCNNERFVQALIALVVKQGGVIAQHVWGDELLPVFRRHISRVHIEKFGLEPIIVATA